MAREKRAKEHYVDNKKFTQAVIDYTREVKKARAKNEPDPIVPDYIASCLLRMCEGLSHKSNFIRYTYREEMVMDGVENCLKALANYDGDAKTRSGNPNAFGYFTQISWFAFLRRITKEKKQQELKLRFIAESGLDEFMIDPDEDPEVAKIVRNFVDELRRKIDDVKDKDQKFNTYRKQKIGNRKKKSLDSDLTELFEE
jgi:DNA-directed RNA polymerase specialized sigma24 family protein